jgi:hypothetical protein
MTSSNPTPAAIRQQAAKAADWLVNSGVQVRSDNPLHSLGFACWYDSETQTMPYVYSEITGYLTTMMCDLYDQTGDARFLESARGAAAWLARTAHPATGGFRCLYPIESTRFDYKNNQIYIFDTGVIISGLVDAFRASGDASYLQSAVTAADWLIRDLQKPNGAFYPVYEVDSGKLPESDQEWSLCSGSYHTKVAIGLINLFDLTGNSKYRDAAIRACDYALSFQQADGRFISFPAEGGTNSHPHAYSAEGLWVVGSLLGRQDYLDASARAAQWLLDWQSPEGVIPRHFHEGKPLYNERVDVLGQALRLASIHIGEGRLKLTQENTTKLDQLVALILRNQAESDDVRVNGGFYFGRLSDGTLMPHVNVWVTAFAIQGLTAYAGVRDGNYAFKPIFMV